MELDEHDRRLLGLVQRNNRQSYDALAAQVHLSPSAVRRRLNRLRNEGVIVGDVALINPAHALVTVITSIRLLNETTGVYRSFKQRMLNSKEVSQCYTVSGEADFIVIGHFANLAGYEAWIDQHILNNDDVQRSDTNIVYSTTKFDTAIDVWS